MLKVYRALLRFYPSAYREEYDAEMMAVLTEIQAEQTGSRLARIALVVREARGLLRGALGEHYRRIVGFSGASELSLKGGGMRSEFRFPKATHTLMTIILIGVVIAIDKARAIQASVSYSDAYIGPVREVHFTIVPSLVLTIIAAYITGAIGWAVMFSLKRFRGQRFSEPAPFRTHQSH